MAFTNDTIYGYLPRFYQIEANNLKALQPGFVVAQVADIAAAATFTQDANNIKGSAATTKSGLIANGHIVSLTTGTNGDGKAQIEITDAAEDAVLYIVYNDPIITFGASNDYARYATKAFEVGGTAQAPTYDYTKGECLRLVQLIPGDEWMTDMEYDLTDPALTGRIVEVEAGSADNPWYGVNYLADGTPAKHYMFLG